MKHLTIGELFDAMEDGKAHRIFGKGVLKAIAREVVDEYEARQKQRAADAKQQGS